MPSCRILIATAVSILSDNAVNATTCVCQALWSFQNCVNIQGCPAHACSENADGVTKTWCYVANPGCVGSHASNFGAGDWAYCEGNVTHPVNAYIGHHQESCYDITVEADDPYCWQHVTWAMETGIKTHPQYYYPNYTGMLTVNSPRIDFQCVLSSQVGEDEAGTGHDCPVPCSSTMKTCSPGQGTTQSTTTVMAVNTTTILFSPPIATDSIKGLSISNGSAFAGFPAPTPAPDSSSEFQWWSIILFAFAILACMALIVAAVFFVPNKEAGKSSRYGPITPPSDGDSASVYMESPRTLTINPSKDGDPAPAYMKTPRTLAQFPSPVEQFTSPVEQFTSPMEYAAPTPRVQHDAQTRLVAVPHLTIPHPVGVPVAQVPAPASPVQHDTQTPLIAVPHLTIPQPVAVPVAQVPAPATPAIEQCPKCGTYFKVADENFCRQCGATRPSAVSRANDLFNRLDSNQDGVITREEFSHAA